MLGFGWGTGGWISFCLYFLCCFFFFFFSAVANGSFMAGA